MNKRRKLLKQYFSENSIIKSNIDSFNHFVKNQMPQIVEENKLVEPTIIPDEVEEYEIYLDDIWVGKPRLIEADGSERKVFPSEARLRQLSYSAPVFMSVHSEVDGVERETIEKTQVGKMPVMLKSDYCHLQDLSRDELIDKKEDPTDPGGYFIVNGTEKIVVNIEDLASNRFTVEEQSSGVSDYVGKVFSEEASYKIPHKLVKRKDGIFYLTFTRVNRMPLIPILKACGLTEDKEIMEFVDLEDSEVMLNLLEYSDIKSEEDAIEFMAEHMGITQSKEARRERVEEVLDEYLLPHIGDEPPARIHKAYNLCKFLKKFITVENGELDTDDKDHYLNKRLQMSGDLLAELFRVNLKVLVGDMLYNFQRQVKRGKHPSIEVIIREKLLTQRMYSAMATGNWVGGRKGVSQRMERLNFLQVQSHLQRVVSPLSSQQENFEARALHPTHLGRLCPSETPEGSNIGLRKNQAILARAAPELDEQEMYEIAEDLGMEGVE